MALETLPHPQRSIFDRTLDLSRVNLEIIAYVVLITLSQSMRGRVGNSMRAAVASPVPLAIPPIPTATIRSITGRRCICSPR